MRFMMIMIPKVYQPASDGDVIEVRQVFEMSDFPADVREAAGNPTVRAGVERRKSA
jgi:hypothetical protein